MTPVFAWDAPVPPSMQSGGGYASMTIGMIIGCRPVTA